VACLALALAVWASATPGIEPSGAGRLSDVRRSLRDHRVAGGMWLISMPGLLFGAIGVLGPLRLDALGASGAVVAGTWLVAAGLESTVSPVVGRLSDRHGRLVPVFVALALAPVFLLLLPAAQTVAFEAALIMLGAPVIGILWAPASAMLSDGAEAVGLDQALGFALLNLGWALGQVTGAAASGALAQATTDAVPYAILVGVCLATLAVLVRGRRGALASVPR